MSHPSWVRGLKPFNLKAKENEQQVTPLVGAHLGTLSCLRDCVDKDVAPLVGAWIET